MWRFRNKQGGKINAIDKEIRKENSELITQDKNDIMGKSGDWAAGERLSNISRRSIQYASQNNLVRCTLNCGCTVLPPTDMHIQVLG